MTVGDRLAQIEIGRKKGLREGIDALNVELQIARAALSAHRAAKVKEGSESQLIDRIEVWIAAIETLESM
jgi:hypothetical protein